MTKKEFILRVNSLFPFIDFSNINFVDLKTPIELICPEHGAFSIIPSNMLYKNEGCKFCGAEKMVKTKSFTKQEFIKKASKLFDYDYSLTNYKNTKTKIKIICKQCGTVFEQYPCNLLKGYGCPKCKKAAEFGSFDNNG